MARKIKQEDKLPPNFRRMAVAFYRSKGMSFRLVVESLVRDYGWEKLPRNYDVRYAHDDWVLALKEVKSETAEYVELAKKDQLLKIERLMEIAFPKALAGDASGFNQVMRLMGYEASLLGIFRLQAAQSGANGIGVQNNFVVAGDVADKVAHLLAIAANRRGNSESLPALPEPEQPFIIEVHNRERIEVESKNDSGKK